MKKLVDVIFSEHFVGLHLTFYMPILVLGTFHNLVNLWQIHVVILILNIEMQSNC